MGKKTTTKKTAAHQTITNSGDWLWDALKRARTDVTIVSPWLSRAPVQQLLSSLDSRPKDLSARVVFRWPRTVSDAWALDADAVQALSDDDRVTLEYLTEPLHAKLYLVDKRVLVSSANFTSAGLGQGGLGNLELGVKGGPALRSEVREFIDRLPTTHLNSVARKALLAALSKLKPGGRQEFPKPPASLPESRRQFTREVLEGCHLRPRDTHLAGHHNVWLVGVGKGHQSMKAHTSVVGDGYHFEIKTTDDAAMKKRLLNGLLLLPYRKEGAGYLTPDETPAVVVVERHCLYDRRGLTHAALKGHDMLSLMLDRGAHGWRLSLPGIGASAPLHAMRERKGRVLRLRPRVWTRVK